MSGFIVGMNAVELVVIAIHNMILPNVYGSVYNKRLIAFYVAIYHKRFGEYPKINYSPLLYIQMKRAFDKYGEIKVAGAILFHFEQKGDRILQEKFPLHWVFKNIPDYMLKLSEYYDINVDNEEELYDSIKNRLNFLAVPFVL